MLHNIQIQELVDEIWHPDIVCKIDNEVPKNVEDRYLHILYSLVNIVKRCVTKGLHSPYIHIKDVHGELLFNDRLNIINKRINKFILYKPEYCEIHLIKKRNSLAVYYYAFTPQSIADNNRFYLNQINFSNGTLNLEAYQKAATAILKMVKKGGAIDDNTLMDTSVTLHNYDPDTKQWSIDYHRRSKC